MATKKRKSKSTVASELGAIHQWMKDHERHDDQRFAEGSRKMSTLATKDDIQTVMIDQASKADMQTLTKLLVEVDPETGERVPRFATKKDVQPVVNFYNNLMLAAKITSTGGKWSSRIFFGLLALIAGIGIFTGYFKAMVIGIMAWAVRGGK